MQTAVLEAPAKRGVLSANATARAVHEKRIAKIAAEIAEERSRRTAAGKRRVGEVVIREQERSEYTGEIVTTTRVCRKYLTTLDQLEKRGQLEKHLRVAFDKLAEAVALSSGACVDDFDLRGSSARGIASAEGGGGGQFGSRSLSDQVLRAENLRLRILKHIPQEMKRLASQLIMEETGMTLDRPTPLVDYGKANGFNSEQQARSSGATMVIDLCRIVHHVQKSH